MSTFVTYIAGAATTLVVQLIIQFWVVPRVETLKRRDDRWERNVLELGELLGDSLSKCAQDARNDQSLYRFLRYELEGAANIDPDKLAQERKIQEVKARQSTAALETLVHTRMNWLVSRITAFDIPKPCEIVELESAARRHKILVILADDYDNTDPDFDADWDKEFEARKKLMDSVQKLAERKRPLQSSLYRKVRKRLKERKRSAQQAQELHGGEAPGETERRT